MPTEAAALASAVAKVRRRLIPFLFLLYIVAYVDRINVGFAALQMNRALGFSAKQYGFGAGIFFLSYIACEIPSNIALARVGARVWIARIMITWGLVSSGMMLVRSAGGFYAARLLLGAAEAGFFPGIIFFLTRWCPVRERARMIASFMTATLLAGVVGAPISGALLKLDGVGGLAGWQWLFLLEGVPAVVLGFVVLRVLPERPEGASWLSPEERAALASCLAAEALARTARAHTIASALKSPKIWLLAIVYFTMPVASYGIGFWLPQIIKTESGGNDAWVGVLTAVPYVVGAIGMVLVGRHSDRMGERRWHIAIAGFVGAAAAVSSGFVHGLLPSLAALSIAMLAQAAMLGPFWALATSFLSGGGAAAGIALINSVANLGGFIGPYMMGYLRDATHSFAAGLIVIGAFFVIGASLVLTIRPDGRVETEETEKV
jgi:ACS family tartrate transporter-like MFS transporter